MVIVLLLNIILKKDFILFVISDGGETNNNCDCHAILKAEMHSVKREFLLECAQCALMNEETGREITQREQ